MEPLHVLVIADNDVSDLLSGHLGRLRCRVTRAVDGARGLDLAHADPPDVVFVDVARPGVDGRDVAARLRADPGTARCRLVATPPLDRHDPASAAFDAMLPRPFRREDVEQVLTALSGIPGEDPRGGPRPGGGARPGPDSAAGTGPRTGSVATPPSSPILIADDDDDIRELVAFKLEAAGFVVVAVDNGLAALSAARETAPALAVLDVMMPGLSGIDVCRALRAEPATSHLPVILLTARAQEGDVQVGFGAGADDYVVKPFSPRELVSRVEAVLARTKA